MDITDWTFLVWGMLSGVFNILTKNWIFLFGIVITSIIYELAIKIRDKENA